MSHSTASSDVASFSDERQSIAYARWMQFILLALAVASNAIYAHTPLVAFAVMSGVMLTRHRAVAIAILIWFVNQAIGFGLRGYPLSATAFIWGALMGLGVVLVVAFASIRPRFSRTSLVGYFFWVMLALIGGFALYQGLIMLAYPMLANGHTMGWDVIARLFRKQVIWTGAIALGHGALFQRHFLRFHLARN
jgi:hypothetical protein